MVHYISNNQLQLGVKAVGAEIESLFNLETGIEHIWEGNAAFWTGQAPILFPIIGELNQGKTLINGKTYHMRRHGFLRKQATEVHIHTENTLVLKQSANAETMLQYPFNYTVYIGFELIENRLRHWIEVENHDIQEMPFAIGLHPAFALPFLPNETLSDYYLQFEKVENEPCHRLDENGLFTGETVEILKNSQELDLTPHIFDDDALVFKSLKSTQVQLKSRKNEHFVQVDFEGWPYLGVWSKPAAPYVCTTNNRYIIIKDSFI